MIFQCGITTKIDKNTSRRFELRAFVRRYEKKIAQKTVMFCMEAKHVTKNHILKIPWVNGYLLYSPLNVYSFWPQQQTAISFLYNIINVYMMLRSTVNMFYALQQRRTASFNDKIYFDSIIYCCNLWYNASKLILLLSFWPLRQIAILFIHKITNVLPI